MKKTTLFITLALLGLCSSLSAQDPKPAREPGKSYFKFQPRIKIGIGKNFTALPMKFDDFTMTYMGKVTQPVQGATNDFLKTKWGIYGGANLDFYLHPNFGFGLDFDYFNNKIKFITPQALVDYTNSHPVTHLIESDRKNQSLIFVGIGPSFKILTTPKWDLDANLRVGLSHLDMGSLSVSVDSLDNSDIVRPRKSILVFDYHKAVNTIGIKVGIYGNYWFNSFLGITLGVEYIHSFVSAKKINDDASYVMKYKDPQYYKDGSGNFDEYAYFNSATPLDNYPVKSFNVNHIAVSAGLVFKIEKVTVKKVKEEFRDIIVLVKDSLTNIPVAGVGVNLIDNQGKTIHTSITEENGKVTFEHVPQGDYTLFGRQGELKTNRAVITASEFSKKGTTIYRELLLSDLRFILSGVTVECDQKDKTIGNVNVELTNTSTGKSEKTISGPEGKFTFNLEPNSDYTIVASKDGYYSGIQEISTKGLDRSKTLYVKLVLCVNELKVGSTFVLNNIYYDFDKCNIRQDASVDLDHLVEIMRNYPKMEIELSSHTDQRGTDAYNNKLSQCRAESAVDYIVGKGISKARITAVGYGKTKPIEDCTKINGCPTTSQGDCPCHQKNRRTEIKILKM